MLDKVAESENTVLLLDDFNIDLLKPSLAWKSTFSILGLNQIITQPTNTFTDHIIHQEPEPCSQYIST